MNWNWSNALGTRRSLRLAETVTVASNRPMGATIGNHARNAKAVISTPNAEYFRLTLGRLQTASARRCLGSVRSRCRTGARIAANEYAQAPPATGRRALSQRLQWAPAVEAVPPLVDDPTCRNDDAESSYCYVPDSYGHGDYGKIDRVSGGSDGVLGRLA
jgi:hypothetical protein